MLSWFSSLNPLVQSFLAGVVTFLFTLFGSAVIFVCKKVNKIFLDSSLAFSAGIMLSASFFSLLNPALEFADNIKMIPWLICSLGVIMGGLLILIMDLVFFKVKSQVKIKRQLLLISSITIHNIPEGLVLGVAFGFLKYNLSETTIMSAIILTIGIAIQNFPEGLAVSLPLKREGFSSVKSFIIGTMTGIVEPIFSVLGALLVLKVRLFLPLFLSFAAGSMLYVICKELIPESQNNNSNHLMTFFTILGFIIMMILDLLLS